MCSNIEEALTTLATIESKACVVDSKVDALGAETLESKLEALCDDLVTVESQLDLVSSSDSKLCVIDSKLDQEQLQVLALESLVDAIGVQVGEIESKIDTCGLLSQADQIESKVCEILPTTHTVCSELDLLITSLETSESKLDEILSDMLCTNFGTNGLVTTDLSAGADVARAILAQTDGKVVAVGNSQNNFALARYNDNGSLDSSFGTGGTVTTDLGGDDLAYAAVLQSDGKIVAVGENSDDFALVRYNTDGSLDGTFGTGGIVTTDLGGNDIARAALLQADGKIVAVGLMTTDFALARYNTDGSLDGTFGTGGIVTTNIGGADQALAGVLQSDGKIVAVGRNGGDWALVRYNTDGSLDGTFGAGGIVTTNFGGLDIARAALLQADGKIVVAGQGSASPRFCVARYNTDGSLDGTFGTGGIVTTSFGGSSTAGARGMVVQSDGKLTVVGQSNVTGGLTFALARYNTDGSLDTSFDGDGLLTTAFPVGVSIAYAAALKGNGELIVVGTAGGEFALACYGGLATSPIFNVETIVSQLEEIDDVLDMLTANELASKLCLIQEDVCTVASNVDVMDSLVAGFDDKALGA